MHRRSGNGVAGSDDGRVAVKRKEHFGVGRMKAPYLESGHTGEELRFPTTGEEVRFSTTGEEVRFSTNGEEVRFSTNGEEVRFPRMPETGPSKTFGAL